MKATHDFKKAFGKPDAEFTALVAHTLADLRAKEERPVKKVKWGLLAAVVASLIVATVAYAAVTQWGILDFLGRYQDVEVLPDAANIIETNVPQQGGEGTGMALSVRQALFDGTNIYLVAAVQPAQGTLLLGPMDDPNDTVSTLGGVLKNETGTIAEYAAKHNLTMRSVSLYDRLAETGESYFDSFDWVTEEGGTLVFMLNGKYDGAPTDALSMELVCTSYSFSAESGTLDATELREAIQEVQLARAGEDSRAYMWYDPQIHAALDDDEQVSDEEFNEILEFGKTLMLYSLNLDDRQTTSLQCTLTIPESVNMGSGHSAEPVEYADCGVRVDDLRLTLTPMAVYAEVEFTVIDEETYAATDSGLWFEFLDTHGERMSSGAAMGGEIFEVEPGRYRQTESLGAMEALPESVTLRGFNCWEKNRYESHEITIVPD